MRTLAWTLFAVVLPALVGACGDGAIGLTDGAPVGLADAGDAAIAPPGDLTPAADAGRGDGSPVTDSGPLTDLAGEVPTPDAGGPDGPPAPVPGDLDVQWIHGSPSCASNTDPPLQVHRYNEDTFILRQNKCVDFEGPFLYLFFGQERAILFDTGATSDPRSFPVFETVQAIIDGWLEARGQAQVELVVAHSHSHGDHVAGDGQFEGQTNTTVVSPDRGSVQAFFGIGSWPEERVSFELGGRTLEILPTPGHEPSHIAVYDPHTQWLLTGDSLYPGRLYVQDWEVYRASIARLVAFSQLRPVNLIMGTHIEMSSTPGVDYPIGTDYQPDEHPLPLPLATLLELDDALQRLGSQPTGEVHDSFIIYPVR